MIDFLSPISKSFYDAGHSLYIVGGSVRNSLLSLPASDLDLCGDATPDEVFALFENSAVRVLPRAIQFGTVEIQFTHQNTSYSAEYTTFRHDSYRAGHRPEHTQFTKDIRVDAFRRDFRINALYQDAFTEAIVDPTGGGMEDLSARRISTVTQDPVQVIKDDGLRILRMVRFSAQLGFHIDKALLACARNYVHLLKDIVPERLCEELKKILLADLRYPELNLSFEKTVHYGLHILEQIDAFPYLFADLSCDSAFLFAAMQKLSTNVQCTTRAHGQSAAEFPEMSSQISLRLALYLHKNDVNAIKNQLLFLRFSTEILRKTCSFVENFHAVVENIHSLAWLAAKEDEILAACVLYLQAARQVEKANALERQLDTLRSTHAPRSLQELAIDGHDLLSLLGNRPATTMRPLLQEIFAYAVQNPQKNSKDELIAFAKNLLTDESFRI